MTVSPRHRSDTPPSSDERPDAATQADPDRPRRRLIRRRHAARWFDQTRTRYPWLDPVVKWGIAFLGVLLIVVGILIAPVPGPGGFVSFLGIALLASEFRWARKLTRQAQAIAHRWSHRLTGRRPKWAWRWKKRMSSVTSSRRAASQAL